MSIDVEMELRGVLSGRFYRRSKRDHAYFCTIFGICKIQTTDVSCESNLQSSSDIISKDRF